MSDEDLRFGDVVRLVVCADAGAPRIVRGEGHVLRNLTAVQPERRVGDDSDYLFQVTPELEHNSDVIRKAFERHPGRCCGC